MRHIFAIAAMVALAAPTMAAANDKDKAPKGGHAGPAHAGPAFHAAPVHAGPAHAGPIHAGPAHVGGPVVMGHGHPVHVGGPVVGHPPYVYHGHNYAWHPVAYPHPWVYPSGYAYRLWVLGDVLPEVFWRTPTYYYADWALMGLPPPEPGFQYVEYGPDLLLVNVTTGAVVQVFPGAFS